MKRIASQIVCLSVGLLSTPVGAAEDAGTPRIETQFAAPAPQLRTTSANPIPPVVNYGMPKWLPRLGLDLEADSPRVLHFVDAPLVDTLVDTRGFLDRKLSPLAEYSDPLRARATIESSILSSPASMDIISPNARFLREGSLTFGTIRVHAIGQFSNR
jgi:hypothetical protein